MQPRPPFKPSLFPAVLLARHWPGLVLTSLLLFTVPGQAVPTNGWPVLALPSELKLFDIGSTLYLHGSPMQVQGFVSDSAPAILLNRLRDSLGQPLVENQLGRQRILGRAHDGYYLTVQIEPTAHGSRGLVAITPFKGPGDKEAYQEFEKQREKQRAMREPAAQWLARMPADSRLASDLVSQDGRTLSRHLLVFNRQEPALNAQRLKSLMAEEGYQLQADSLAAGNRQASPAASPDQAVLLFFHAPGKQAMATVQRQSDGQTAIVLNLLTMMEHRR